MHMFIFIRYKPTTLLKQRAYRIGQATTYAKFVYCERANKKPVQPIGEQVIKYIFKALSLLTERVRSYCNLNVIGILKGTLTALPLCLPGVILGNLAMILAASFSRFLSGPRILTLPILPSFCITNIMFTLP